MWGENNFGQLGIESIESTIVPIKIMEGVKSVELNSFYTGAITEEGDLYMWGSNDYGQLGNGSTEDSSVPIKIMEGIK
ncbi:MAG: hypothetical protein IJA34_11380, partial [Lachnospiraceae bacterium]|nr:hypothetical protein [Lachnospiraceae bacterium]